MSKDQHKSAKSQNIAEMLDRLFKQLMPDAHAKHVTEALKAETIAKYQKAMGPRFDVPKPTNIRLEQLRGLGFPSADKMISEMVTIIRDKEPFYWKNVGAAWGKPSLDEALVTHPHALIGSAILKTARSCFDPEDYLELETYFSTGERDAPWDTDRVVFIYALYRYLTADDETAGTIAQILPMTDRLRADRHEIQQARALYAAQRLEVDAFDQAMRARGTPAQTIKSPNWKTFLKTRLPDA